MNHHTLEVDLKDLIVWNDELAQKVQEQPGEMVPLVRPSIALGGRLACADVGQLESALLRFARQLLHPTNAEGGASTSTQTIPDMQVTIRSGANLVPFRELNVRISQPFHDFLDSQLTFRQTP